jgi:outer membrane usher protein
MGRSARPPCSRRRRTELRIGLFFCGLLVLSSGALAQSPEPMALELEVFINGQPTHLIGGFFQWTDSRIGAKRPELAELGIKSPEGPPDEVVPLAAIGLSYKYDLPHQTIDIAVPDQQRIAHRLDATTNATFHEPQRTTGAYLNYTGFVAGDFSGHHPTGQFDAASLNLEGDFFGPFGALSQSGIIGTATSNTAAILRLNTEWSYSDPGSIMTYRAGDLITGGLAWTRPLRLGGVQVQRDFAIRPDLITLPLPTLSGSAAVPSTVDVYLGDVKTYSTQVPSGPYQIDNLPVISGSGEARLVVTDSTGRVMESTAATFTDARLLRQGLFDFSAEAGWMRLDYGIRSWTYDDHPVATASGRFGLTDQVTLQGHGEAGDGLINLGAGATVSVSPFGLLSGAAAVSDYRTGSGLLFYGAWDYPAGDFNFHASTQRTNSGYRDLASLPEAGGSAPPHSIDQITAGYRLPGTKFSFSLSAIRLDQPPDSRSTLLNLSFDGTLENGMTITAAGFRDLEDHSFGAFIGLTLPLGDSASASLGVNTNNTGTGVAADVVKSVGLEPGSVGGSLAVSTGGYGNEYVNAYGAARFREGLLEGSVTQLGNGVNAYASFSGAVVADGGSVLLAQRIDDAFAVVDAGAPGVEVMRENQPVGVTDSGGKLLVTGLNSYQENRISIDAGDLPVTADVPITEKTVVPAARSGVVATFGIEKSLPSAIIIFTRPDGSFVDAGARGAISETGESFVVGYDGRAFVKKLGDSNRAIIKLRDGQCQSSFAFVPHAGTQVTIGPLVCK